MQELEGMGSSLEAFGLPSPDLRNRLSSIPKTIAEEMFCADSQKKISSVRCQQLNQDQQDAFCAIMNAIHDDTQLQRLFFINAPGGYGKTFLIETLLCTVRGFRSNCFGCCIIWHCCLNYWKVVGLPIHTSEFLSL